MSERLSIAENESSLSATTREERRRIRRVGVSLQVRIRNAEADDGDFEEVRTTLNTSRKAIYFFTPLNGYYKGMKLKVTFPYDAQASANLEQMGEVVRVHRRGTGFGVAVALKTESEAGKPKVYGQDPLLVTGSAPQKHGKDPLLMTASAPQKHVTSEERRCAKRTAFVAPVELIEMRSGSRIHARVADLSLHGCYVDTLNPLPVGSEVRLRVEKKGEILDVVASVSSQHPGSGMGLEFRDIAAEQRAMVRSWLAECADVTETAVGSPGAAAKARRVDGADQAYAIRLINALVKKGILSKSEATELLRDPES